jgi:hypothetical protein
MLKLKIYKMKNLIVVFLLAGLIAFAGCNKKAETTGEKKEEVKPDQTQANPNDSKTSTDNNKGSQGNNDLGMSAGIPSNYPTDVPQPKDGKCLGSLNSSDGTIVTFETTQSVKDVWEFYKSEMKKSGFESDGNDVLMNEKGGLASWKKDKREVGLMLGANTDNSNKTSIVITYK